MDDSDSSTIDNGDSTGSDADSNESASTVHRKQASTSQDRNHANPFENNNNDDEPRDVTTDISQIFMQAANSNSHSYSNHSNGNSHSERGSRQDNIVQGQDTDWAEYNQSALYNKLAWEDKLALAQNQVMGEREAGPVNEQGSGSDVPSGDTGKLVFGGLFLHTGGVLHIIQL